MAGSTSAYQTAAGKRWRARYARPDGTRTEKRGFTTRRDALQFLATTNTAMLTGEYIEPERGRTTVGELGPKWLKLKRGGKPSYVKTLERDWRVYVEPRWAQTPVSKIKPSDVAAWIQDLSDGTAITARAENTRNPDGPRSASVVLRCLGILRGILDLAVDDRRILKNPAAGVKNQPKKHSDKPRRYLTDAEVAALAQAVADPMKAALVLLLAYTGLRWGEAAALRVRDVNMLRRRLHVNQSVVEVEGELHVGATKTWEKRTVPFPKFLTKALDAQTEGKPSDALVFSNELGGYVTRPTTAEDATSWYRKAIERAGLERLTLHDLRHTAASLAIRSGANVKVVQRMLGHKSAAMTLDTYADLFDDDLDSVAELMSKNGKKHATAALKAVGIA